MHSASFQTDPKHLAFVLARYQFVARMLEGFDRVLEVGCGEGTGAKIVQQAVKHLVGIDIDDSLFPEQHPRLFKWDILQAPFHFPFETENWWNAVYALDVLEHIPPAAQNRFFKNIVKCLAPHGVLIIGTPSLESQRWASSESRKHHVNCRTEASLRGSLREHFHNVFLFGMNDTTLHTGFGPMVHYRLAVCTGGRS